MAPAQDAPGDPSGAQRGVVVFACGHPLRGDDSLAYTAVHALPPQVLARADVKLVGAMQPEYLRDLPADVRVVIVDAVVGVPAGSVLRMRLYEMSGRAATLTTASSHQLPLDEVVALAQLLRDEPVHGWFVGLGIESVAPGEVLSPAVAAALPLLTQAVAATIVELDTPPV